MTSLTRSKREKENETAFKLFRGLSSSLLLLCLLHFLLLFPPSLPPLLFLFLLLLFLLPLLPLLPLFLLLLLLLLVLLFLVLLLLLFLLPYSAHFQRIEDSNTLNACCVISVLPYVPLNTDMLHDL